MPPFVNFMSSPIGLFPKKEAGRFRLIQHLSWPEGDSVNDFIDPSLCTVSYARCDDAVEVIQKLGYDSNMENVTSPVLSGYYQSWPVMTPYKISGLISEATGYAENAIRLHLATG